MHFTFKREAMVMAVITIIPVVLALIVRLLPLIVR
jgi:hypothetical protein